MEVDPDYTGFAIAPREDLEQEERSKILQENAREAAVEKIKNIINEQFDKEIQLKEDELMRINQKLADARCVMDRLRACVVASFYAASFTKPVDGAKGPEAGAAYHPAIQNVMRKAVTAVMSKNAPHKQQTQKPNFIETEDGEITEQPDISTVIESDTSRIEEHEHSTLDASSKVKEVEVNGNKLSEADNGNKQTENLGGRQRIKKTIIVGNVSKYIPSDQREASDKSTHKWMVYVRGSKEEPRIDHFVRKVWFFLHPSYRPNDLVEVCEAPFHLTRRGWGEFPIRVQIHFCDRRNRPVDIIHGLRLDRTYTSLQTLGAETVCEVELDRSSVQITVDDILEVSNLPHLAPNDDNSSSNRKEKTESPLQTENDSDQVSADSPKDTQDIETETETQVEETTAKDEPAEEVESSGKDQLQSGTTSPAISASSVFPPRKREHNESSEAAEVPVKDDDKPSGVDDDKATPCEELSDEPTPHKRKRKRRMDNCRTSASEDDVLSDTVVTENTSAEEISEEREVKKLEEQVTAMESVDISGTVGDATSKEDTVEARAEGSESSQMEIDETDEKDPQTSSSKESTNDSQPSSKESTNDSQPSSKESTNDSQPSSKESANDSQPSSGSSDVPLNIKQPIVLLPRSPVSSGGFFRMRSASDGDGIPNRCTTNLLKSGVSVSSVINVSLNPEQRSSSSSETPPTGSSPVRKVTVLSPKSVIFQSKGTASQPIVLSTMRSLSPKGSEPNQEGSKPVVVIKKETSESSPGHITIPLSSLLRNAVSSQPQVVKLAQPSVVRGQTFSVGVSSLSSQGTALKREKRSFSADHSPARTISLAAAANSGSQQPIQLHIINPQGAKSSSPKRSKPASSSVTFQTLQAALSSRNITLSQPQVKKRDESQPATKAGATASQQQFVLATVVNPKGKQHLALINPSTLSLGGSKKLITITSSKGKKVTTGLIKQSPVQNTTATKTGKAAECGPPSQKDRAPVNTKPEPIHKVLGDKIHLHGKVRSFEDDILPLLVELIPLVNEKRDLALFPFCAKTEADFLEWNVGKQRASEWQRACLMQKVLKYIQDKNVILGNCKLPTKKFIMNWCVRHGYSVFTDEYVDETEEESDKNMSSSDLHPTMTSSEEILKLLDLKKSEQSKENNPTVENDDDVIFVDVVNVEPPTVKTEDVKPELSEGVVASPDKDSIFNEMKNKIQSFVESEEVSAIEEITREVGLNLHRMYGMPTCHLVLAKALQQFAKCLIRKSLSCTLERRDGSSVQRVAPEEIQVADVVGAICGTSTFDFLTDCNIACQSSQ